MNYLISTQCLIDIANAISRELTRKAEGLAFPQDYPEWVELEGVFNAHCDQLQARGIDVGATVLRPEV
jgi:hypothetical protein